MKEEVDNYLKEQDWAGIVGDRRDFADELLTLIQLSGLNNGRMHAASELLMHLNDIQAMTLVPVLRTRFPKAASDGGSVSMAVRLERKLPAEMTLTNTGRGTLHNVVAWFRIEMNPQPGFTAEEMAALQTAYSIGAHRAVFTKMSDRKRQDLATGLGSLNIVFIPELKPGEDARIVYELGSIRRSKRAVFSLYSDELKISEQPISGVREMNEEIETGAAAGPGRSSPEPGASGDLFYKGSIWRGTETQPGNRTHDIQLVVLERDGESFRADMRWSGRHGRYVEGTIKAGAISWQGAKGERNPGSDHFGKLAGKVVEGDFTFGDVKYSFKVDYVPPK